MCIRDRFCSCHVHRTRASFPVFPARRARNTGNPHPGHKRTCRSPAEDIHAVPGPFGDLRRLDTVDALIGEAVDAADRVALEAAERAALASLGRPTYELLAEGIDLGGLYELAA